MPHGWRPRPEKTSLRATSDSCGGLVVVGVEPPDRLPERLGERLQVVPRRRVQAALPLADEHRVAVQPDREVVLRQVVKVACRPDVPADRNLDPARVLTNHYAV